MTRDPAAFIRAQTQATRLSFVPDITLHLACEITPIWQAFEDWSGTTNSAPPFWAFAWPGSMALAHYMSHHPESVRGLRVLDFASGCGLAAIMALKKGAAEATIVDIDPLALMAAQMNATENGVQLRVGTPVDFQVPAANVDLIIAGDVCYEQAMSIRVMRWLRSCVAAGSRVLLADPHRAYAPDAQATQPDLKKIAAYEVPVLRELEDRDARRVTIWELESSRQS